MYLDLNILQSVPASNINRDDTGAPKTIEYGGTTRAMVSSQSWKHAMRENFKEDQQNAHWLAGIRTREMPKLITQEIMRQDSSIAEADAQKMSQAIFDTASIKTDKSNKNTQPIKPTLALLMLSKGEIQKVAQYAINNPVKDYQKKELQQVLKSDNSVDLALFGRMVANDPTLNVDATCQVAPAMSTHTVVPQFDFYTAVDDDPDVTGAAMMDTTQFNTETLYRYTNLNVSKFAQTLGKPDVTLNAIKLFIKEFITSMPTGKQNSFANHTNPAYVLAVLRDDAPVNLSNAFEAPVVSHNGYLTKSIHQLETQFIKENKFSDQPVMTLVLTTEASQIDNQADNLNDFIDQLTQKMGDDLTNEDPHN